MSYAYLFKYIIIGDTGEWVVVSSRYNYSSKQVKHVFYDLICHVCRGWQVMPSTAVHRQEISTSTWPDYWWVYSTSQKPQHSGSISNVYASFSFVVLYTFSISMWLLFASQEWSLEHEWSTSMVNRSNSRFGIRPDKNRSAPSHGRTTEGRPVLCWSMISQGTQTHSFDCYAYIWVPYLVRPYDRVDT